MNVQSESSFSDRLRDIRQLRGLSQQRLAGLLGVKTQSYVLSIFRNSIAPRLKPWAIGNAEVSSPLVPIAIGRRYRGEAK